MTHSGENHSAGKTLPNTPKSLHKHKFFADVKRSYERPREDFTDFAETSLEDLLKDVEGLLKQFGVQRTDPLELLLEWARRVYREVRKPGTKRTPLLTLLQAQSNLGRVKKLADLKKKKLRPMMIHEQILKPNWNVLSVISVRVTSRLVIKQQKRMFMMNWSALSANTVPEIPMER